MAVDEPINQESGSQSVKH